MMGSLFDIIGAVLPPFLLMIIGGISRRKKWLPSQGDASMSRFIIWVLYPSFILWQVLQSKAEIDQTIAWVTPAFGFGAIVLGFGIAIIIGRVLKLAQDENRSFSFCSGIFNYGFFAIPVASLVFGEELIVKIILFNLGVEIAIWTVGILLLTSTGFQFSKIINPPVLSVILAIGLQKMGGPLVLPAPVWELVSLIGKCSIPMGLMVIGAGFYDLLRGYNLSGGMKFEMGAVFTRNFLIPSAFLLYVVWGWVPANMDWMREILIVQAAMPSGVFALLVVNSYGQRSDVGVRVIIASIVASLISIPLWIYIGVTYIL